MDDAQADTPENDPLLAECETAVGYRFTDRSLLKLALTHSSLRDLWTESNERLEFLGDSVIGLAVAEHIFCTFPDLAEGELTRIKSIVVSRLVLAEVARDLDLRRFLRVGKGISKTRTIPPSLLANTVEAMVGAIYLDAGFEVARDQVLAWAVDRIAKACRGRAARNYKADLQQLSQRLFSRTPVYDVLSSSGPDHRKEFVIQACITERRFPQGKGTSKKQAEQRAARNALRILKQEHDQDQPAPPVA